MRHLHGSPLLLVIALGVLVLSGGCGGKGSMKSAESGGDESGAAEDPAAAGIELSVESRALAEITIQPVRYGEVRDVTHTTGEIQVNGRRVARIVIRLPGWVDEVMCIQGDLVRRGDVVLTIHSPEYQAAGDELLSAWRRLGQAQAKGDPDEIGTASAIYASSRKRLLLYGESEPEVEELLRAGEARPILHVHSPFDGTIIQNSMVPGHRVEPGAEVCFISDLRTVWAILNVFEKDLSAVRVGSPVEIKVGAYAGRTFEGKVDFVDNVMEEATRTVKVRVDVTNADRLLKPGMFVDGDIDRDGKRRALVVPIDAVQQEGSERFVFLAREGRFFRQLVEPGTSSDAVVEINAGLQQGDSVVVGGAFILKSELLKSGFGEE